MKTKAILITMIVTIDNKLYAHKILKKNLFHRVYYDLYTFRIHLSESIVTALKSFHNDWFNLFNKFKLFFLIYFIQFDV